MTRQKRAARIEALQHTGQLDTLPDQVFGHIAQLAALICGPPIALISLVDEQRQWFKTRVGLAETETPKDMASCSHAILSPDVMFVVRGDTPGFQSRDWPS